MKVNKFLFDYVWDTFLIAGANGVDIGIGRDMFCTNLNNYGVEGAEFYEGANEVDYAKASKEWKNVDQAGAKVGCKWLTRDKYSELTKAYREGKRNEFQAIVNSYEFSEEAVKELEDK